MADEIRALTVKQPYAWAITCAGKTAENRGRPVSYRGLLAIHAGKARPRDEDLGHPLVLEAIADQEFEINEAAASLGAIVAVAELTGCHHSDECMFPWAPRTVTRNGCSPWAVRGQWHWQLANVRPLVAPVTCRGNLGLWHLPPGVEANVRAQMEAMTDA